MSKCQVRGQQAHGPRWSRLSSRKGDDSFCRTLGGFPGGSNGKESACNAGDRDLIPGLGRSHGEGNDNPFQYFCVQSSRTREAWWAVVHGVSKSQTGLSSYPFHFWNMFKGFLEREKKHTFQIKKTPPFSSYITLLNLDKILI